MCRQLTSAAAALLCMLAGLPAHSATPEGWVKVNSVVVDPAVSIATAETTARREALEQALKMRGNLQIRAADRERILTDPTAFVETRLVLNKEAVGGKFQPAFYFNVNMPAIDRAIQTTNVAQIADYDNPRIQVALVIRRLPSQFDDKLDREQYVEDLNTRIKEFFGREGFYLEASYAFADDQAEGMRKLYQTRSIADLEGLIFNRAKPPASVDYYLYGLLDVPDDALVEKDGGAYWQSRINLTSELIDLNSGQPVSNKRIVEGTGDTFRAALENGLQNVTKSLIQKASAPDILRVWKQNMQNGMTYDITFCNADLTYEKFDALRDKFSTFGRMSGSKSADIPLYTFTFPGGRVTEPSRGFQDMLVQAKKELPQYASVVVAPIVYQKRKVYMFNDHKNCAGGGNRSSDVTR